jgi:hypothetical protein
MVKNNFFCKIVLSFVMLLLVILIWVVQSSSLTSFSGIFALVFVMKTIYEYKTPKNDRIPLMGVLNITLFITLFGLGIILLLQAILSWEYNPLLPFLYGLSGVIFLITALYDRETWKNFNKE